MLIREITIEPNRVYVGENFKIKVRVQDDYKYKKRLIAENGKSLIIEANKKLRTEWGK